MKRVIYKYTLDDRLRFATYAKAEIMKVAMRDGKITIWAIVNKEAPKVYRHMIVFRTNDEIGAVRLKHHIATLVDHPSGVDYHIFDGGDYRHLL